MLLEVRTSGSWANQGAQNSRSVKGSALSKNNSWWLHGDHTKFCDHSVSNSTRQHFFPPNVVIFHTILTPLEMLITTFFSFCLLWAWHVPMVHLLLFAILCVKQKHEDSPCFSACMHSMAGAYNNNAATIWILHGAWVTGSHGWLILNPNPNICWQVREKVFGYVVEAIGHNQYSVLFDNEPTPKICPSGMLKIADSSTAVPVMEEAVVRAIMRSLLLIIVCWRIQVKRNIFLFQLTKLSWQRRSQGRRRQRTQGGGVGRRHQHWWHVCQCWVDFIRTLFS